MRVLVPGRFTLGVCLFAVLFAGCNGNNGALPDARYAADRREVPATSPFVVMPLSGVSQAQLEAAHAAGKTIPFFTGSIKSPLTHKQYGRNIVGENPQTGGGTTYVPYVLIPIVYHFRDGTVLDPTKPACNDTVSIEQRVLNGPNFVPTDETSNGVDVGKTQLGDAFQRAEFWKVLKSPQYHVVLQAARAPVVVHVQAPAGSSTTPGVCPGAGHRVGTIAYGPYANMVRSLSEKYVTPRQVAIFVNYNIIENLGSGGIAVGAHGAFARSSGIQAFIFAAYNDSGAVPSFPTIEDILGLTHEIGELFNDPFPSAAGTVNVSPPWGHVGVYRNGCSKYLEVGDPLVGVGFDVKLNGFTYHPQDLAFESWFFRTKSVGTGGLYSFQGTFKTTQPLCNGFGSTSAA